VQQQNDSGRWQTISTTKLRDYGTTKQMSYGFKEKAHLYSSCLYSDRLMSNDM